MHDSCPLGREKSTPLEIKFSLKIEETFLHIWNHTNDVILQNAKRTRKRREREKVSERECEEECV